MNYLITKDNQLSPNSRGFIMAFKDSLIPLDCLKYIEPELHLDLLKHREGNILDGDAFEQIHTEQEAIQILTNYNS